MKPRARSMSGGVSALQFPARYRVTWRLSYLDLLAVGLRFEPGLPRNPTDWGANGPWRSYLSGRTRAGRRYPHLTVNGSRWVSVRRP
jgi:hypothetical protein